MCVTCQCREAVFSWKSQKAACHTLRIIPNCMASNMCTRGQKRSKTSTENSFENLFPRNIVKREIILPVSKRDGARYKAQSIIGPFVHGNGNNSGVTVSSNLATA